MYALVIDDSSAMRKIISRILKRIGFQVIEAVDGQDGIEKLEANRDQLAVALVDWNMPRMTGIEMVKAVRARQEFNDHRLIMVTTETEPERMAQALMAGANEFIMKPFTDEILVEKLRMAGVSIPTVVGQ